MSQEKQSTPTAIKIGDLLIRAGAFTSGDLTEAIQIAKRMGVPIGRVLVMSGFIVGESPRAALRVLSHQSVNGYRQTPKPIPEIARELNVEACQEAAGAGR